MCQESMPASDRQAAADAITLRAMAIGKERGVDITRCVWEIGEDLTHAHAHCLDICTETKLVRIYFPDVELMARESESRKRRTEERLNNAIAQLLPRVPSPTYAFDRTSR